MLPSVGVSAVGVDYDNRYGVPENQAAPDVKALGGSADVSWEIDLSGRLRAGAEAAAADAITAEHGVRGVRLLVLTDVASSYFTLVGALRQLETVRAISAAHDETLRLVIAREHVGFATPFDVERAQTDASRARAAIPPLETLAAVSRHRIAVLIGDQAFNAAAIAPSAVELSVPPARPGQPASLLERRPDLLALESQLDAANWRRQQAKAEYFPRLFASALLGRQSVEMNDVGLGSTRFSVISGLIAMPLFNWGRTQAINETAEAGQTQALLRFEDGIVRALEDVENALVALRDERQRAEFLRSAVASAEAALGRAQSLYNRGQTDLLPLLDAQRSRLTVQISANDSSTRLLLDSVQLYKALGGGWQVFEPAKEPS
jgi:NodT family efflux transporter outer membrane factor (OMF) lipoprotein